MGYIPKKLIIPAAGDTLNVPIGGCALVVQSMNTYSVPEQQPIMYFGNVGNNANPLYPQWVYRPEGCDGFDRFVIEGTTESAGDSIYILVSDVDMKQEISDNAFQTVRAVAGVSFEVDLSDDTVRQFTEIQLQDADGRLPTKIYISTRGGAVAYAFNATPEQAAAGTPALGTVLMPANQTDGIPGDKLEVDGINFILAFRYRPAVSGTTPSITIDLEY